MSDKNNMSSLTILICCYNAERFLDRCLSSLVSKSAAPASFDILFVDDGSCDNSLRITRRYAKILDNMFILENKKNEGLVSCCNKALSYIKTPYFMRIDADDYLCDGAWKKISKELSGCKENEFIIFKRWDLVRDKLKKSKICDDIYTWIAAGTIFGTKAVKAVGGYNNEHWEEYDLYIRLLEAGYKHKISPYRIYCYRRGHASMTLNGQKNKDGFERLIDKWGMEVFRRYGNSDKILSYYGIAQDAGCTQ